MPNKTKARYRPGVLELLTGSSIVILAAGMIWGGNITIIPKDLDRNGIPDRISKYEGQRIVLFGVQENNSINYLNADEMQQKYSSATSIDYLAIQHKLNN